VAQKSNKKLMAGTIIWETKGKAKERPKDTQLARTQKRGKRKLVSFMVGNYLTHGPSNVACMQIMKSNSMGGLEQTSPTNTIFLSIVQAKAC
jgi:hypothetical protein